MRQLLDIDTWVRRDHFHFFRRFEEPFFGVTVQVECTHAYQHCKAQGIPFFLYYLYQSLAAANETLPFRYRIGENGEVWIYDTIHASPVINRPDGTIGFAYMNYHSSLETFLPAAQAETERVRHSAGLVPAVSGEAVIHYSALPWINFTAVSHARSFSFPDSAPKITFGQMTNHEGQRQMPMSIHVHHALMDGSSVGEYLTRFQLRMNMQ